MDWVTPQILGVISALILGIAVFEALRRAIVPERFATLWIVLSVLLLLLAVFPQIGEFAARITGVQLPVNLLFFLAAIFLLLVSVQFSYEIGKIDARTRRLAEEVAILRERTEVAQPTGEEEEDPGPSA